MNEKPVCISHSQDVDGLASASLVKRSTSSTVILTDYDDLLKRLSEVRSAPEVYVCDLGLDGGLVEPFIQEVRRIRGFARFHYIDHHPLKPEVQEALKGLGVDVNHSLEECTAVLAYLKFKDRLKGNASLVAAYGAVTDYRDDGPEAKKIIGRYDRQFVLLESTLLSYALGGAGGDLEFRYRVVDGLTEAKMPHEIKGVSEYAQRELEKISRVMAEVSEKGERREYFACMETTEGSEGTMANLLLGSFDVSVGVAYRRVEGKDEYEVSLRGAYDSEFDLGEIVSRITVLVGGTGGGHKKASGARIPAGALKDFLDLLDFELDKSVTDRGRWPRLA